MRAQAWLFNLSYRHLKAARPRAAAHMSLHQKLHCQRAHRQESADSYRSPLLLSGDVCPACWRPSGAAGWLHPVGGVASKQVIESRQQSFCNFISISQRGFRTTGDSTRIQPEPQKRGWGGCWARPQRSGESLRHPRPARPVVKRSQTESAPAAAASRRRSCRIQRSS